MRTYLVVIDASAESALAQRFAARRAAKTGGNVHIVVTIEPSAFVAWGGVQATIEEEARQEAEGVARAAANALTEGFGLHPSITVEQGNAVDVVRGVLASDHSIAALVLGAAAESGNPGPLVSHFAGTESGNLSVPLMIIPGSLTADEIDRLS